MFIFDEDKIIEIFCKIDDLTIFKDFEAKKSLFVSHQNSTRKSQLADSEIITILVIYHQFGYESFKDYYTRFARKALKPYFPGMVIYS
jgi:hypothetical protein